MTCPLHAWGDESIRSHGLDAPAYLPRASLIDVDQADRVRDQLRRLRAGARKLHWYDMNERHRRQVIDQVRRLDAGHLIVIDSPMRSAGTSIEIDP
ncbi:hypothetical protein [Curtobacterium sp. VKM Ac-2922]|uniref:hypothetical protein n=1 Tax=Curtobacterium sp. VKM Ac-2922 TaxID=2929475 RepID=UPI001FB561FD|nr:hypothetical protein [Curtobacterium sp. VKM Ac-2922]MCJ1713960.1 hypothetical protein [Curtobacterium sp. VKM Ac-2922]